MKKKAVLLLLIAVLTLSACADYAGSNAAKENDGPTIDTSNCDDDNGSVAYTVMSADWPVYENTQALMDAGNLVLLGEVTGISFQILDIVTAEPPTDASLPGNCYLHTIYDVSVASLYQGTASDTIQVRMLGGRKDYNVKEQRSLLDAQAQSEIPLLEGMPDLEIGETYLFVLHQYESAMPTPVNVEQGVYSLDDPSAKDSYSYVSPQEIIAFFGADKWSEFQSEYMD